MGDPEAQVEGDSRCVQGGDDRTVYPGVRGKSTFEQRPTDSADARVRSHEELGQLHGRATLDRARVPQRLALVILGEPPLRLGGREMVKEVRIRRPLAVEIWIGLI